MILTSLISNGSIQVILFDILIVLLVIGGSFLSMLPRIGEEKNKISFYTRYFCYGRFGKWLWHWPLRISLYGEFMVIYSFRKSVLLKWQEVDHLEIKSYWYRLLHMPCLVIFHKKEGLHNPIVLKLGLYTLGNGEEKKVKEIIESHLH